MYLFFSCWGPSKQHDTVLSNLEILVLMKAILPFQRCALFKTRKNHSHDLMHIHTYICVCVCLYVYEKH